jgi:hypothetical protein
MNDEKIHVSEVAKFAENSADSTTPPVIAPTLSTTHGPKQLEHLATARSALLSEINTERTEREQRIISDLRAYILDRAPTLYQFGGVSNLCTILSAICEQEAENQHCPDYLDAATVFKMAAEVLDLPYNPGEPKCD